MSLPCIYKFTSLIPKTKKLHIVCPEKLISFWQSVPWIDACVPFKKKRFDQECQTSIKKLDPGAVLVLPNSFGSAWELKNLGLPNLIGRVGRGRKPLLNHRLPTWKRMPGKDQYHESRKYLELATSCGYSGWDLEFPDLILAGEDKGLPEISLLDNAGKSTILVLAPGAAYGPAKQWPADFFNQVAKWWSSSLGPVVVVGTKKEMVLSESVIKGCKDSFNLAGKTSISQMMTIVAKARCILTNDSGTMHLAAALGKNGVAIFGSTDPIPTGPIGGNWVILKKELYCSPCLRRTCPRVDFPYECLQKISPRMAIEGIDKVLVEKFE